MDLALEGVHVLITGASGGIGLETVRLFLEQGAKVTAHFNSNSKSLEPLLGKSPEKLQAVKADLRVEDDVVKLFSSAQHTFGSVQIIIVNHAIFVVKDDYLWEMSLDRWRTTIDTNLTSSFLVTREYLKQLRTASLDEKEKAAIIIGSTAGKYGEAGHADFAASKSAMMYGLTMSLKNEIVKIAPKGRVNCIGPGWVRTPMAMESLSDPNVAYSALATTPLKKIAVPYDIATQIVILSSNKLSGHVTGQVLMVEGGMEGRLLNKQSDLLT